MDVAWNANPAPDDPRLAALHAAERAMSDPTVVAHHAPTVEAIESHREALAGDRSVFDPEHGDVTVARVARVGSSGPQECRFLQALVDHLAPQRAVEMGTAVGISGAYMAAALPPGGRLWTVDRRPAASRHARTIFERLALAAEPVTGVFDEVLDDVLATAAPVDLLFVDGHHQEAATLRYTDVAWPHLADRAVVVFDDVQWSDGMARAWASIRSQDRWVASVDFGLWGVCLR